MKAFVNDFVRTKNHNHQGRINHKHINFKHTSEEDWWFNELIPKPEPETKDKPWYSILCHNGGSVLVPESDITIIEPIEGYSNMWANFYFKD